jgi:hypothetical protein
MADEKEAMGTESKKAARQAIARIRQSGSKSTRGRTKIHLLGVGDNVGLAPELEEATRKDGSARRLVSSQVSQPISLQAKEQTGQKKQYELPTIVVASWCPFDRGRLTAAKVMIESKWSKGQSLYITELATGVWMLKPNTKISSPAHVDNSRRICLTSEWIQNHRLTNTSGLLVGFTKKGVLIIDVRRAHFNKEEFS